MIDALTWIGIMAISFAVIGAVIVVVMLLCHKLLDDSDDGRF